ncbi:peptidoglycan-binding protein LysM [Streptomyces sp. NPDC056169]|uniref:peptidoglycan-binding protein LysM n=1 Tax=Streptomyces sp. NPDC056169 TaxID=3345734 RepID=UPI0035E08F4F
MGTVWIPGAVRLGDGAIGGPMDSPELPPRVVWHTTESGAGNAAFDSVGAYLIRQGSEPHFLYDPTTDRLGQFGPLDRSARALRNDGDTRTNRTGRVCVQIEVLARAATPFTGYWKPGPNFRALMAAARSWGVPDTWAGRERSRTDWRGKGGHFGHVHVPGNDHWDPGKIDPARLFAAAGGSTAPAQAPASRPQLRSVVSLARVLAAARTDPAAAQGAAVHRADALPVEKALAAEGLLRADWADGSFGTRTLAAYAAWQRRCGYTGADADGMPGRTTLERLGTAHGFQVTA